MSSIVICDRYDKRMKLDYLIEMFALRYQTFCERLCWKIDSRNGLELDDYDAMNPVYMLALNESDHVEGCWRMVPTSHPNMLRDVFPQLCNSDAMPHSDTIWEISRWATVPCSSDKYLQAAVNPVTVEMIAAAFSYARENNIAEYVVVTSVAMERLMKRVGLPISRMGNPSRIGKVLSVACRVPINKQFEQALETLDRDIAQWKTAA